jgi:hypothetical protein
VQDVGQGRAEGRAQFLVDGRCTGIEFVEVGGSGDGHVRRGRTGAQQGARQAGAGHRIGVEHTDRRERRRGQQDRPHGQKDGSIGTGATDEEVAEPETGTDGRAEIGSRWAAAVVIDDEVRGGRSRGGDGRRAARPTERHVAGPWGAATRGWPPSACQTAARARWFPGTAAEVSRGPGQRRGGPSRRGSRVVRRHRCGLV